MSSEELDRRARTIYMAMDPTVSYLDALKFAAEDAEGTQEALQFAGADPESVRVHLAATKEIAAEKAKGNTITYFEAARRVERSRA